VKASLLQNSVPNRPGGGTVFFVTSERHRYLSNFVEREEGGTPDIVGSIRAAMAFDLRYALDARRIEAREMQISKSRASPLP
jgi:selenocysteine lyase/cysteine desulfurase